MMRGIIGVDGWWTRSVQSTDTTGWWGVSSGSGTHQRTDNSVTRMRWMSSGIMIVMMRYLNKQYVVKCRIYLTEINILICKNILIKKI